MKPHRLSFADLQRRSPESQSYYERPLRPPPDLNKHTSLRVGWVCQVLALQETAYGETSEEEETGDRKGKRY